MVFVPWKLSGTTKKLFTCLKSITNHFNEYCLQTTFHGFRYIGSEGNNYGDRIIWSILCIMGFTVTGFMSGSALHRLLSMPTMTSIESIYYPLGSIPFPGVTICNRNRVYIPGANKLISRFEKYGWNSSVLLNFFLHLRSLTDFTSVNTDEFKKILEFTDRMGYDSEKLMLELSQPCSELLVNCSWLGKPFNCTQVFQTIKTPKGFCCSFNWHANDEDSTDSRDEIFQDVLYATSAGSPNHGLSVVVDLQWKMFQDSQLGAVALIHDGTDYPEFSIQEAFMETKYRTIIRIEGSIIESTPNVRALSPRIRQCWFDDELTLKSSSDYSFQTCMTESRVISLFQYCACIPFYYPQIIESRYCSILDVPCLKSYEAKERIEFQKIASGEIPRRCLPQCTDKYFRLNLASGEIYSFDNKEVTVAILDVYFQEVFCMKYRKESLLTWDGLLSAVGGIFGICLGGSILSIMECVYFFTYKTWCRSRSKPKTSLHQLQRKTVKPILAPVAVGKQVLPEIFQLHYDNIIKKNIKTAVTPFTVERYYP